MGYHDVFSAIQSVTSLYHLLEDDGLIVRHDIRPWQFRPIDVDRRERFYCAGLRVAFFTFYRHRMK